MPPRRLRRRRKQRKAAAVGPVRHGRLVVHIERERAANAGRVERTHATKSEAKAATIKPTSISVIGRTASGCGIWNKSVFGTCAFVDISSARSGDVYSSIGVTDNIIQAVAVPFRGHLNADITVVVNKAGGAVPLVAPEFFNVEDFDLGGTVGVRSPELALSIERAGH